MVGEVSPYGCTRLQPTLSAGTPRNAPFLFVRKGSSIFKINRHESLFHLSAYNCKKQFRIPFRKDTAPQTGCIVIPERNRKSRHRIIGILIEFYCHIAGKSTPIKKKQQLLVTASYTAPSCAFLGGTVCSNVWMGDLIRVHNIFHNSIFSLESPIYKYFAELFST